MPETTQSDLAEKLEAWSFNVMLECSGREESDMLMAVGGAFLDLRDLNRILGWARDHYLSVMAEEDGREL